LRSERLRIHCQDAKTTVINIWRYLRKPFYNVFSPKVMNANLRCHHIQSSKHLGTLRLVSKNFHDAVKLVLFHAAALISGVNYEAGALAGLKELINRNLVGYVRSLTIRPATDWLLAANSAIQELLVKTPLLESFGCSCPILPETVGVLRRLCTRFKSLSFDFGEMEYYVLDLSNDQPNDKVLRAREQFTIPDLTVSAGLAKLSLLNLYGDLR
jgi:hypothetical protein